MDICNGGNPGKLARNFLKKLFTPAEISESILYPNDTYAKPGLDANRMKFLKVSVFYLYIHSNSPLSFCDICACKIIFFFNVKTFY